MQFTLIPFFPGSPFSPLISCFCCSVKLSNETVPSIPFFPFRFGVSTETPLCIIVSIYSVSVFVFTSIVGDVPGSPFSPFLLLAVLDLIVG